MAGVIKMCSSTVYIPMTKIDKLSRPHISEIVESVNTL